MSSAIECVLRSPDGLRQVWWSNYSVRAFPLRRQLVCTLGGLNAPKDKVAFLKTPGMNPMAVIATQGLLVACSMRTSLETVLLE